MKTYDVAVIGAGVFGSWIAYRLAQEGRTVELLDAYGAANARASSGGESRILRMAYGADEMYTRLSFRALELWLKFLEGERRGLFYPTGALFLARAGDKPLRESRAALRNVGVPFEEWTAAEVRRRYPRIGIEDDVEAIFEPSSGALMARQAVAAVVEAAVRAGVEYRLAAVEPVRGRDAAEGLRTSTGERIAAGTYVFACGPWLPKVFPAPLGRRIFPTRQEVMFFGAPAGDRAFGPEAMPVWLDRTHEDMPYGFPDLERRGFKMAFDRHGEAFDPDEGSRMVEQAPVERARAYLARRFPALAKAPLIESRVCQYENTSSGDFLIDRHPEFSNVWMVGGGSGHGFKHGPAVAEYFVERLMGRCDAEPRFGLETKEEVQNRRVF